MPSSGVQTCALDRKSTRLNSSHTIISYAVFCLKKKNYRAQDWQGSDGGGRLEHLWVKPGDAPRPRSQHDLRDHAACHIARAARHLFFFKDTATPEISSFSLRDPLPI